MKYLHNVWSRYRTQLTYAAKQRGWQPSHKFSISQHCKKNNIIVMGSPGSGKTVVGQCLASNIGCQVIDIDNDYLENHWGVTVAQKLDAVGGDKFLDEEGKALLNFHPPDDAIISLTGSNPMHKEAMDYTKSLGTVIFLDVQKSDILHRLDRMKVDRIVGQEAGTPMSEILNYRQHFYEKNYDIRILCEEHESIQSIVKKVQKALAEYRNNAGYVSTRNCAKGSQLSRSFNDVVLEGLATDGGLYIPGNKSLPHFTLNQWQRLTDLTYPERAIRILEKWIHPSDIHPSELSRMISTAYNIDSFDCHKVFPTVHLQDNMYVNELFYGPTASFKDAALQLLPEFFQHAQRNSSLVNNSDRYLFLVATSGDTGSAVLSGFNKMANSQSGLCKVMVLYPEEGVSEVQKQQMKTFQGHGLHVVGVNSDFDFCQSTIKQIFTDHKVLNKLKEEYNIKLSAANSINWGRLLPQIVYHACGYLDLVQQKVIRMGDPVDLCIPTGNFGNILAAYYAKAMGIPYRRLICASNVNNVLTDFFNTGCYDLTHRKLHVTAAPAIDILRSSNLERYLYHVSGGDSQLVSQLYGDLSTSAKFSISSQLLSDVQRDIIGDWCTEEQCSEEILQTFQNTGYLLDTHTAVAKVVADRHNDKDCPLIITATAHYAKFVNEVLASVNPNNRTEFMNSKEPKKLFNSLENLNCKPVMHNVLKECLSMPVVHEMVCEPNVNEIVSELFKFVDKCENS